MQRLEEKITQDSTTPNLRLVNLNQGNFYNRKERWKDEWMDGQMEGWIDGCLIGRWVGRQVIG